MSDFIFLGSKITADGDRSHEIKRCLLLGRKVMRNQEGRSGSDEVVPGTSVFPSSETRVLGNFWGRIKGAKYRQTWEKMALGRLRSGGRGDRTLCTSLQLF